MNHKLTALATALALAGCHHGHRVDGAVAAQPAEKLYDPAYQEPIQIVEMPSDRAYSEVAVREIVTQDGNFCIIAESDHWIYSGNSVAMQCYIPPETAKAVRKP